MTQMRDTERLLRERAERMQEAIDLLRTAGREDCWCTAVSIDNPDWHTSCCTRVREILRLNTEHNGEESERT